MIGVQVQRRLARHFWLLKVNTEPVLALAGLGWLFSGAVLSLNTRSEYYMPSFFGALALIVAFFSARTSGMAFNRLIDACIDAKNPRTAKRILPSGQADPVEIAFQAIMFLGLFLLSTFFLPLQLRWLAVGISCLIVGYSFTKRFTSLCHYILGIIHFCIPLAGAMWIVGDIGLVPVSVWFASTAAFFSVASSDILYSLQDEHFDRRLRLYSIPVLCGRENAIRIALGSYVCAFIAASISLFLYSPSVLVILLWSSIVIGAGFLWRSFSQAGYILSGSLLSFMLPFLPLVFSIVVMLRWISTDTL